MKKMIIKNSICIMILLLLSTALSSLSYGDAKEFTVFRVEYEDNYDTGSPAKHLKDFYIDGGKDDGLSKDMVLDVYRKKTVQDINKGKNITFSVPIGEILVDNVYKDVATTRIISLTSSDDTPILEYRTVMLGDYAVPRVSKEKSQGLGILFPSEILFALNKWDLKPEAKKSLSAVYDMFNKTKKRDIIIEGHTCSLGNDKLNKELSRKRAKSVADYLKKTKKIPEDKISIKYFGEQSPIASNKTPEGRSKNRRVVVRFQNLK